MATIAEGNGDVREMQVAERVEETPVGAGTEDAQVVAVTDTPGSQSSVQNGAQNGHNVATAGVAPAIAPRPAPARPAAPRESADATPQRGAGLNRREFLTYAWGAALGLLSLQAGVASFQFLYPRFRAGEFGGKFFVPLGEVPPADQAPNGSYTAGKFWLVTTEDGSPRALYMVCVHLGCLYKWVDSNFRFECPCHGSKYTHDGYYIEGPAARSLDYFEAVVENGELVVDTGSKILGAPAAESPYRLIKA